MTGSIEKSNKYLPEALDYFKARNATEEIKEIEKEVSQGKLQNKI